jgi:hypothetical protein
VVDFFHRRKFRHRLHVPTSAMSIPSRVVSRHVVIPISNYDATVPSRRPNPNKPVTLCDFCASRLDRRSHIPVWLYSMPVSRCTPLHGRTSLSVLPVLRVKYFRPSCSCTQ